MINKNFHKVLNPIKMIIALVILFFLVNYVRANAADLQKFEFNFNYLYLAVSLAIMVLFIINQFLLWHLITIQNQCNIRLSDSIVVRAYSEFGKYVPGKVLGYAMLLFAYSKENKSKLLVSSCMFYELLAAVFSATLIFLVSLFFSDIRELQPYRYFVLTSCLLFFVGMHPRLLNYVLERFMKAAKREPVIIKMTYIQLIAIILLYAANFMVFGIAFMMFIKSVYAVSFSDFLFITGTTAAAGVIGMLAIFVPAGLGVREGILIFTLSYIIPPSIAGVIALSSRIWITVAEIIVLFLVFIYSKLSRSRICPMKEDSA